MFLRKIFSSDKKFTWVIVDLFIVITGVYCAFLLQSEASESQDQKERVKIFSTLKMELETMRVVFPQFSKSNTNFLNQKKDQEFFNISSWRFIEPQYSYQIIEYAINIQNTEIINFEMYNELQELYVGIKQLEHMERLLTDVAGEYQYLIKDLPETHPLNLERKANNSSRMARFRSFLHGRANNLIRISEKAEELLNLVNEELGSEKSLELDSKYILDNSKYIETEEEAIELGKRYFPHFSEGEILELYRKYHNLDSQPIDSTQIKE